METEWKTEQKQKLKVFTNNTEELQIFQNSPISLTKNSIENNTKKSLPKIIV